MRRDSRCRGTCPPRRPRVKLAGLARRALRRGLPVLVLLLVACTPYSSKVAKLRGDLAAGRPGDALVRLDELSGGKNGLPYLMEKGLLQYLAGDLDACQESFAAAQATVEDLYTKSLSREAATLIFNDTAQAYQGEIFERVWIHYYRALAFLAAGETASAAVEGRAVTFDLQRFSDSGPDEAKYRNDPFLQYFAGLLYEADGELNDAWINYREAERLYEASETYGVSAPDALLSDLVGAGERMGFEDLLAPYREKYPDAEAMRLAEGEGELVLLVSTGLVPPKVSNRMDFPIFKDRDGDRGNPWLYASNAYDDWRFRAADLEVDYILSIALPAVEGNPPPLRAPRWEAGGRRGRLELGADLGALNKQCLEDRYGGVVVRTVARALIKYWGKEKIEEKKGEMAGLLVNILGSATEVADTRGWTTLPAHVHVARVALPAGEQTVSVHAGGAQASGRVEIRPGRLAFLAMRIY